MLTAVIFLLVIGVLVLVHELGHFIMAKRAGMRVEEFGFGFPPRLLSIKKGETVYSINCIPFGGFVKITGEDGSEHDNPRSFSFKSASVRTGVIVAGVVMNVLLATVLLSIGHGIGQRVGLNDALLARATDQKIQIIQIDAASPAQVAGLKILDEVMDYPTVVAFQNFINAQRGQLISFQIRRDGQILDINLTPRLMPPPGQGAIGISLALTGIVRYAWWEAIKVGIQDTYYITRETILGYATVIKNLFLHGNSGVELSGPIGIAVVTGQAVHLGFTYLIQLVALISINLAILNIIPFPALDGGRILFIIIEKLKGTPIPKRVEGAVNFAGFALLIMLMVYVTSKDIIKFFK